MAYTLEQKRYFARELARSGGNVAAAVTALRRDYESLRNVGESTVRRFLDEIGSATMIAEEGQRLAEISATVAVETERVRLHAEIKGSEFDRLARDEAIIDDLRDLVKGALQECIKNKEEAPLPVSRIAALYERMTRIHDARRQRILPAISTSNEVSKMIRIFAEEALTELGAKAQPFMKRVRDRIERELYATPAPDAPASQN